MTLGIKTSKETVLAKSVVSEITPKRRIESYCKVTVSITYQDLKTKT